MIQVQHYFSIINDRKPHFATSFPTDISNPTFYQYFKHISYFHQMMEQQLKGGVTPRTWYREHAHPVLLPLDEEETHLLRSLVGAARQLNHHVILIHHALDGPESKELDDLAGSLQGTVSLKMNFLIHL